MKKHKPFRPAFGLGNAHLQTLFPALFRKQPQPEIEIERFELSDGDFVECFWHRKPHQDSTKPIVVLFHGLEGSYLSPYIQGMMNTLGSEGFSSVLMHFRGCSGKINRLPRSYHSGDTGDAKMWIESLVKRYPKHPLFAIGYSLGGNMLLKLLGEWSDASPITAAVSVSAPMQLEVCADRMNSGFSRLYQNHLMKNLRNSLLEKYTHHPMHAFIGIDENRVKKLKNFWEFDDVYTAPIHGFTSASEYYQQSSAKQFLKDITTDTLIIQALDDPFMTPEILPDKKELSSHVKIELSPHGGHVGFVGGSFIRPKYWLENRITDYLKTAHAQFN